MLNNLKNAELNENELMNVNGGNWLTDAWDATCNACSDAWDATCEWAEENKTVLGVAVVLGGVALCCTGVGIAMFAPAALGAAFAVGGAGAAVTIGGTVAGGCGVFD
ncbi:MAG: hypothetical protein CW338_11520 [Clostridiales bacterium]|nr:hypothetical protein [Clostridiales bacterium]